MLIDTLAAHCIQDQSGLELGIFNLPAFLESDIPAVCINLPALTVFVLLAEDGSVALIEHGRLTKEFDGIRIEGENLLRDAAAQDRLRDISQESNETRAAIAILGIGLTEHALLAASAGAYQSLGLSPAATLEDLAASARAAGGCANRVNNALDTFGADLGEPLFVPEELTSWTSDARDELEDILTDILLSDCRYDGAWFELTAASSDGPACLEVEAEAGGAISARSMAILRHLVDFDRDFHGHSYEYNDGAAGRRSGYSFSPVRIVAGDLDPCSNHERMAALGRVRDRLAVKGLSHGEIDEIVRA